MDSDFSLEADTHMAYLRLLKCLREVGPFTGLETENRKVGLLQVTGLESEPQASCFFSHLVNDGFPAFSIPFSG